VRGREGWAKKRYRKRGAKGVRIGRPSGEKRLRVFGRGGTEKGKAEWLLGSQLGEQKASAGRAEGSGEEEGGGKN